jgi:hypothetical protein
MLVTADTHWHGQDLDAGQSGRDCGIGGADRPHLVLGLCAHDAQTPVAARIDDGSEDDGRPIGQQT